MLAARRSGMPAEYQIEPISDSTFGRLIPIMQDAFGETVERRLFDWKYRDNPAGPAIGHVAITQDTGEIAAFYGMIPEYYRWGTKSSRIYQSCDTMTHSRHRRKGLFSRLALRTYEQAQKASPDFFAFGFGGPTSTPGFLKMGWTVAFEIPLMFKPRLLGFRRHTASLGRVSALNELTPELISSIKKSRAAHQNSKVFSEDFIRWRLSNPSKAYKYLVDTNGSYAIFYEAGGFTFLFDFWEETPGAGSALARALDHSLPSGSKGLLTLTQRGSQLESQLGRYWFIRNPLRRGPGSARTPFITYGTYPASVAQGAAGWHITPFDHDSY
jgi:hypothetical protein